jgi:hypothetical protein
MRSRSGGSPTVALTALLGLILAGPFAASAQECPGRKIWICHYPPGEPEFPFSICISENSWPAHEEHGDTMGFCENPEVLCGEAVDLGEGIVEMEVQATGWQFTGPFLVSSEGPVTLDAFTCTAVEDQKRSCIWRGIGEPGAGGPQTLTVRFDQEFSDSFECSLSQDEGLSVHILGFSVE